MNRKLSAATNFHPLRQYPAMPRALLISTLLLLSIGTPALAIPELSDDVATCRDHQGDPKARLDACERVIADGNAAPKDLAAALATRGDGLLARHDYDKAIVAFSDALKSDPDNAHILDNRGIAYEHKGQDDLAMADYNLALQKRPTFGAPYNNRGSIQMRRRALQSALDDFNLAVKYAPNMLVARTNRARVLTINGDFDGALADLAEAERIDPNSLGVAAFRCRTFTAMGRLDDAIKECNGVIEKQPKNRFALNNRADAYMAKGNLDAALKDLNAILTINPNQVRAHEARGELYEKRRDLDQARSDYRSAAFALLPFDEYDVAVARAKAQERLSALTQQGPGAAKGRRIALVIGNGAYRNVHALDNPPRDSRLIAASLKGVGFQVVTVANDLSRDQFFETLRSFAAEAEKADWAVVYYAGHGFEIGGVNYLVPVDARLAVDKDAETEAVALEQVIAAVGGARALRLVMLDACRDNPFAPTMQRTIALKLVDKGFSNIEPSTGIMVVYAAKHGETALDGEGNDSPFATALARDIKEPHVEVRKLFDIVRDDVWNATRHEQQPFTYGSPPGREDFYFAGK
jgi:tetratricopeptide (TPR) repeat protein